MKKMVLFLNIVIIAILLVPTSAFGHKLIPSDGSNLSLESSLEIPDPNISWAIYESINGNVKYYSFHGEQGEMFYASIVIPKLENLENFAPSMAFIGPESFLEIIDEFRIQKTNKSFPFSLPDGYDAHVFDYIGDFPSNEFYEPFGQVTYWERQEVIFDFPVTGKYYLAVFDKGSNPGKYALAIGTIEDFSASDFFTILPYAWLETKLFVNDYASAISAIIIFFGILSIIGYMLYRKIRSYQL